MNSRAIYSIQIQGVLDPNWADRMGGMEIVNYISQSRNSAPVTTLLGEVIDQAALAGVLNTVYMLGLPLLSVTYLGQSESNNGSAVLLE